MIDHTLEIFGYFSLQVCLGKKLFEIKEFLACK